jgi:L-lactate dehydrogenase complex protein LldG
VPAPRILPVEMALNDRIDRFRTALEVLAGKTTVVRSADEARSAVDVIVAGRAVVMTDSRVLHACGIAYESVAVDKAAVGITGAEYALADTGTLVVMSAKEARLVSLLPPVHIAVIEADCILSGLDAFLLRVPRPGDSSASTVLITGPSRTADIEQILVRGVHGPGELHVVILAP